MKPETLGVNPFGEERVRRKRGTEGKGAGTDGGSVSDPFGPLGPVGRTSSKVLTRSIVSGLGPDGNRPITGFLIC